MQVSELRVQPSTTLIKARYALALLFASLVLYYYFTLKERVWLIGLVVPAALVVSAASRHLKSRFTTLELIGDRLKMDVGIASKTSRSVPLTKVQDITVSQSVGQRFLGMGNLTIMTAGDSGSMTIEDVNSPRTIAEKILDRVAAANSNRTQ